MAPLSLPEPRELALALQRGDNAALEAFVQLTYRRLYVLAFRLLASKAEAEDVLQDCYIRIFDVVAAGGPPTGTWNMSWLTRIVVNHAIDGLRRRERERRYLRLLWLEWLFPQQSAAPTIEARVALGRLQTWIGELPVEQRAALVRKELEGMTVPQIATSLSVSEGAVEQRLVRARAALRARLGKAP